MGGVEALVTTLYAMCSLKSGPRWTARPSIVRRRANACAAQGPDACLPGSARLGRGAIGFLFALPRPAPALWRPTRRARLEERPARRRSHLPLRGPGRPRDCTKAGQASVESAAPRPASRHSGPGSELVRGSGLGCGISHLLSNGQMVGLAALPRHLNSGVLDLSCSVVENQIRSPGTPADWNDDVNFAPLLALLSESNLSPADPSALDVWRSAWHDVDWEEGWQPEDAASWFAETGVLGELLRARPFDGLIEAGIGLGQVSADAKYRAWTEETFSPGEPRGEWDEAVELTDGSLLVYPNDEGTEPNLSFYAPLTPRVRQASPDESVPMAVLALELARSATRRVARSETFLASDGMCARWLVTTPDGGRDLVCRPDQCPGECRRLVSVKQGGIRTARCAC